jgi:hypothetical protein
MTPFKDAPFTSRRSRRTERVLNAAPDDRFEHEATADKSDAENTLRQRMKASRRSAEYSLWTSAKMLPKKSNEAPRCAFTHISERRIYANVAVVYNEGG